MVVEPWRTHYRHLELLCKIALPVRASYNELAILQVKFTLVFGLQQPRDTKQGQQKHKEVGPDACQCRLRYARARLVLRYW